MEFHLKQTVKYSVDKIKGILYGTFLGDAIGSRFEGWLPDEISPLDHKSVLENPPKYYSDDTQMAISVFEEMVENGYVDQESLTHRFLKRFSTWRGYSGGMLQVFEMWRDGKDIKKSAQTLYDGAGSFGNGAAMRIAPLCLFYTLDQVDLLFEQVNLCSSLTHTHPFGIAGAQLQAYTVLLALNNLKTEDWMKLLLALPIDSVYKIKLNKVGFCLAKNASPGDVAKEIGNGSDALGSVPAAICSVIKNENSFTDSVLFAVSMGGDCDTIGAMAGSVAGAMTGFSKIPQDWLANLEDEEEGKTFIDSLAVKADKKRRGEDSNLR
jgi:poly(ADP-ribose) glycohydrolase ARH3